MKVSEILTNAKALIAEPEWWNQGDFVGHVDPETGRECLCALGAIARVTMYPTRDIVNHPAAEALRLIVDTNNNAQIPTFAVYNDHHTTTHDDVMQAFDKAIATAKASEENA